MLIDLNVHSHFSDKGSLDPEEILLRAKTVGLDGVCFTEDKPFLGWEELKQLADVHEITVLVGLEIPTTQGHFLMFVPDPALVEPGQLFEDEYSDEEPVDYQDLLRINKQAKGVLVPAHPYNRDLPHTLGDRIFNLHPAPKAIEVRNSSLPRVLSDFAIEASEHLKLPGIAGSDTATDLNPLGVVATLFRDTIENEADLVSAIQRGRTWSVELMDEDSLKGQIQASNRRREGGGDRGGRGRGGPRRDSRGGGRGGDRRGGGGRGGDRGGRGRGPRR